MNRVCPLRGASKSEHRGIANLKSDNVGVDFRANGAEAMALAAYNYQNIKLTRV